MADLPTVLPIAKVVDEAKDLRTFLFHHALDARPGQFLHVWLPGVDEKPFSISYQEPDRFGFTVMKVGPFTTRLFELKAGDKLGIRGPYGNGFSLNGEKTVAIVSGGCGCAPVAPLAELAHQRGVKVCFVTGARSRDSLLFVRRMGLAGVETLIATDDGTYGAKGFVTDLFASLVKLRDFDKVYACGPERMLWRMFEICEARKLPCELSLERYMKCAFGVCGSCALDGTGWLVCKDGPVFSGDQLRRVPEFGQYRRDATGKVVSLESR
ncbi:MAG: dihydroorotate dehydrogenase electron transfer subunit [Planctomycetes bacterium]|nr:dihydroorotate dehydrogenase electron transfer subunit [Planctomycetota bacterium]